MTKIDMKEPKNNCREKCAEPLVSIVVPVLNGIKYISETLDSLLGQTLSDIEILVVDAGSTDGTVELLEKYQEKDERLIVLQSDKKSMGCQYNIGIRNAVGKYIGFCESDDYFDLSMIERLYQILEEDDELDYVKSTFDMFIDREERLFLKYNILGAENRKLYGVKIEPSMCPFLVSIDVNMWNGLYRRDFIIKNGISLNESAGAAFQDTGFVLQSLICAKKSLYIEGNSYMYRRDNMNSSVYDTKCLSFVINEFLYYRSVFKKDAVNSRLNAAIVSRFGYMFIGYYSKLPELEECTKNQIEYIHRFIEEYKRALDELDYSLRLESSLFSLPIVDMMNDNFELFDAYQKYTRHFNDIKNREWINKVKSFKRLVIFGAGDIGRYTLGSLVRNGCDNICAIADNDKEKWGKSMWGIDIIDPSQIPTETGTGILLVDNRFYVEIKNQLLKMGIRDEDIVKTIPVTAHGAFENVF